MCRYLPDGCLCVRPGKRRDGIKEYSLEDFPVFRDIDSRILDSLRRLGKELTAGRDEVLHSPLQSCEAVGFILKGSIRMTKVFSSGKELVVRTLSAGEMYGELVCFSGGTYPCWIIASEDCRVFEIRRDNLFDLFRERDFLTAFMADISRKSRHLNDAIEILSLKRVEQRIAYYLLTRRDETASTTFPLETTMAGLADRLGSSREAVSRALGILSRSGLLEKAGQDIHILDVEGLEEVLTD